MGERKQENSRTSWNVWRGTRSWCWWDSVYIILSPLQVVHIKTNPETAQWFDHTCGLALHQGIGIHVYQILPTTCQTVGMDGTILGR